jgi:methylated-DNA-[protein]-cysteine S-methyltransferase
MRFKNGDAGMSAMRYTLVPSPLGEVLIAGDEAGLRRIVFQEGTHPMRIGRDWVRDASELREAVEQLAAYFAGKLREFDLRLAPSGTAFQLRVWEELRRIPYGETRSYGEIARALGFPKGSRAVGAANGRNPLPIVVPCHRVIGASGKLTGYHGGLQLKVGLLELEGRCAGVESSQAALF